nr:MAG: antirepressor protein KilAC domain protein [Bacteriophage sp.]
MNAEIQTFNFNALTLRTLTDENGDPWFVAKDACDVLGYTNASKAISDHVDPEDKLNNESLSSLGQRGGWLVNESGLYSLILSSKLPTAKEFKRWVTHEVLPTIRKHGIYATEATIDQILANPDFGIRLLTDLKEERAKRIEAENQVRELEPKAKALDDFTNVPDTLLVREAAKLLSNAGTPIGEKELREWLSQHGWTYRHAGTWWATSERVKTGHLVMVESISHGQHKDGSIFAFAPTVRITRKGLALIHKRLGETLLIDALETTTTH